MKNDVRSPEIPDGVTLASLWEAVTQMQEHCQEMKRAMEILHDQVLLEKFAAETEARKPWWKRMW